MLTENIAQLTSDLTGIRAAIISKGQEVPRGTPTSQWGAKIEAIQAGEDLMPLVTAIGPPAAQSDTAEGLAGHVEDAKGILATNLTAKGVTATQSEALRALAGRIGEIRATPPAAAGDVVSLLRLASRYTVSNTGMVSVPGTPTRALENGSVRISFRAHGAAHAGYPIVIRVYRNGNFVGTERTVSSAATSLISYSEDFTMEVGDIFELYAGVSNAGYNGGIQDLSFGFKLPLYVEAIA